MKAVRSIDERSLLRTLLTLCALALAASGCAVRPYNAPLAAAGPAPDYTFAQRLPRNSPKLFVVLTFSGGGTRAAAFTLGVLEALAETKIVVDGQPRRLLDEVDVITAVSGGSFTAAYYGLFGDNVFTDFPQRFLYRDVQADMIAALFSPKSVAEMTATQFNRTDAIAEYLDRSLFEERSFTDLASNGRSPYVILNATDLNTGATFSFTQMQFDFLCSNLSTYPVARAVMASAAVPIVFAPIVLRNYPGPCAERQSQWVEEALAERNPADRRFHAATALASYSNAAAVPYVRLVDGGIIDNLGVRGSIMSEVNHYGRVLQMAGAFSAQALEQVEHVLVIASNTQTVSGRAWLAEEADPGLLDTALALSDATTNVLNAETTLLAQQGFDMWAAYVNRQRCPTCPKVTVDFSVLSFDRLADATERQRYQTLPTTFRLDRDTVNDLRALPARLLEASPQYRAFLQRVQAPAAASSPAGGALTD